VLLNGLGLAAHIQCIVHIQHVGDFEELTEISSPVRENGRKKGRSPEERYGKYRWIKTIIYRNAKELRDVKRDLRQLTFGLRHLMEYDSQFLEETACLDGRDEAILQVLRQSYPEGKLPKDIYLDVRRHGLQYHHVTRRIKRMNRRLQQMIGENAAEKVGARWSLSRFMIANWGNKINEIEGIEKEDV
jgi:hypothetical protein